MRLLYITPGLEAGGAERHSSILLPGLRERGVDTRALALGPGGAFVEPLRAEGVEVEVLNMRHRLDLGPVFRSGLVRQFVPDLVVSRATNGLYIGEAIAMARGAAHVHNDHASVDLPRTAHRALLTRLMARRLALVIVVSEPQRELWLKFGCTPGRVAVIANGVEIPDRPASRSTLRSELGIPSSAVVAVSVASLKPWKHVDDFVRGVIEARKACPELMGLVVGEGPERAVVESAARRDPGIRILGVRDDVGRILHAADLLVLTSEAEAFPMAIIEGMAAGLPVIATRVGAVPSLVTEGETGVLVSPGDPESLVEALIRLARDDAARVAMGRLGADRCSERWNATSMTNSYFEALQRAMTHRHQRIFLRRRSAGSSSGPQPDQVEIRVQHGGRERPVNQRSLAICTSRRLSRQTSSPLARNQVWLVRRIPVCTDQPLEPMAGPEAINLPAGPGTQGGVRVCKSSPSSLAAWRAACCVGIPGDAVAKLSCRSWKRASRAARLSWRKQPSGVGVGGAFVPADSTSGPQGRVRARWSSRLDRASQGPSFSPANGDQHEKASQRQARNSGQGDPRLPQVDQDPQNLHTPKCQAAAATQADIERRRWVPVYGGWGANRAVGGEFQSRDVPVFDPVADVAGGRSLSVHGASRRLVRDDPRA